MKANRSRASRRNRPVQPLLPIPDKLYFRIGEVSELTQTEAYVLRYWETEFPSLRPVKSQSGHRLYRREDVETVLEIRHLLYKEGFTIEGARKRLGGGSKVNGSGERNAPIEIQPPSANSATEAPALQSKRLSLIKDELTAILTILSRKC